NALITTIFPYTTLFRSPKEQKRDILKKVGINLLIALGVAVYFGFIMLGYINIERETYINDLKVFSLVVIALTIILFEQAYNKNKDRKSTRLNSSHVSIS